MSLLLLFSILVYSSFLCNFSSELILMQLSDRMFDNIQMPCKMYFYCSHLIWNPSELEKIVSMLAICYITLKSSEFDFPVNLNIVTSFFDWAGINELKTPPTPFSNMKNRNLLALSLKTVSELRLFFLRSDLRWTSSNSMLCC